MRTPTAAPPDNAELVPASRTVPSASSIEWRLPLMISGLLAITLVAFGVLAFTELRQSSLRAAMTQVRTLLATTAESSGRAVALRLAALESAAAQPAVVSAAISPRDSAQLESAMTVLRARRSPADSLSLAGALLIDQAGTRHLVEGRAITPQNSALLDSTIAVVAARDSTTTSAMFLVDSSMRYWVVAPIRERGRHVGYLAERRQLRGSAAVEQQIKNLTGQDLTVFYASLASPIWAGIRGATVAPKFDVNTVTDSFHVVAADGERVIGSKANIRGIPLALVLSINESSVNQRANAFLRRMVLIGVLLLALSMLGAWMVSRRVTGPLKSLTLAARQIEAGRYETREPVHSNDELGELSHAFNRMAERIGESHAMLAVRVEESEALSLQLRQASKAKSDFLAMMSHELRTPLSAIAGYAEILRLGMRGELNEAQHLDLSRIQANQVHLLRIINDILDLAQVESGQLMVSKEPVQLTDVLSDVEPIVLPVIAERKIEYTVHESVRRFVVSGERDRITQVLVNLIANAVRFTAAGGCIWVHGSERDGRAYIHVSDTGIGIAPEKHEMIFQPFVQVEGGASRRAQGTGLGLAISRRIAQAMGGRLDVESELGAGSTFTLELTLARTDRRGEEKVPDSNRADDSKPEPRARAQGASANPPAMIA